MKQVPVKIYPSPFDVRIGVPDNIIAKGKKAIEAYIRSDENHLDFIHFAASDFDFDIEFLEGE